MLTKKCMFVTLPLKVPPDTIVMALSAHAAENGECGSAYMLISEFAEGMTKYKLAALLKRDSAGNTTCAQTVHVLALPERVPVGNGSVRPAEQPRKRSCAQVSFLRHLLLVTSLISRSITTNLPV